MWCTSKKRTTSVQHKQCTWVWETYGIQLFYGKVGRGHGTSLCTWVYDLLLVCTPIQCALYTTYRPKGGRAPMYINLLHDPDQPCHRKVLWNCTFPYVSHTHVHFIRCTYHKEVEHSCTSTCSMTSTNFVVEKSYETVLFRTFLILTYTVYDIQTRKRTYTHLHQLVPWPRPTLP